MHIMIPTEYLYYMSLNIANIAIAMLTEKTTFTYEVISHKVNLSNKTIRNNIPEIILLFNNFNITIQKSPGIGIRVLGSKENILKCYKHCENLIHKSTQISSEIRQNIISFLLLNSFRKITISMLERKLYITRPSIYNDLKRIKEFFAKYSITLTKSRKTGLSISSGEKRIRHCLLDLTFLMLDSQLSAYSLVPEIYQYLSDIVKSSDIQKIRKFILTTTKETSTDITESDLYRASLFIYIAFFRMKNQHFTSLNTSIEHKIKNIKVRNYLANHLKELSHFYSVNLSEEETIYITAQLSVYLNSQDEFVYHEFENPISTIDLTHQFTKHLNTIVKINNTKAFEQKLFPFLEKTIQKFNFDYDCYNPNTNIIIQRYPRLFKLASSINTFTEQTKYLTLPNDAIATITLLLAAVQEKQTDTITCGFWSQVHPFKKELFLNILHSSILHVKLIDIQSEAELQSFKGDLILSTTEEISTNLEVIPIPELINQEFIHLLNEKILDIRQEKRVSFFR